LKALADAKTGDKICQMRISAEALTGVNYNEGRNGNTFMWVQALFAGNVSMSGFMSMKECDCLLKCYHTYIAPHRINSLLCQPFLGPLVNGHVPSWLEMGERITDVVAWHNSEIKKSMANSFPQYALIMDGSPLFAEAECIIHRSIDKNSWKIKELVVNVGLFKKSLNAQTLAPNIQSAVVTKYGLRLKDLCAVSLDQASTNKAALSLLLGDSRDCVFIACCLFYGLSGSAKKHSMSVGNDVLQGLME
jgi:hypothetical protein